MGIINFYLVDEDGTYVWIKAPHLEKFGYDPEEMIGRDFHEVLRPEDIAMWEPYFHTALEKGKTSVYFHQDPHTNCLHLLNIIPCGTAVLTISIDILTENIEEQIIEALSFYQNEISEELLQFLRIAVQNKKDNQSDAI